MADGGVTASARAVFIPAHRRRSGLRRFAQRKATVAVVMCLPLFALVAGLVVYPFFYSIYLSMLNGAMARFVGLFNYIYLVTQESGICGWFRLKRRGGRSASYWCPDVRR